jgi:hypothetical protein
MLRRASVKPPPPTCEYCAHLDRESYKAVGKVVCYQLACFDGRTWATEVKETKKACPQYKEGVL